MMNPAYMPTTEDERRGYLIEEMGELLGALGKTQRWGLASTNPELPPSQRETNAAWIKREIADVRRALDLVEPDIDASIAFIASQSKQEKRFTEYCMEVHAAMTAPELSDDLFSSLPQEEDEIVEFDFAKGSRASDIREKIRARFG